MLNVIAYAKVLEHRGNCWDHSWSNLKSRKVFCKIIPCCIKGTADDDKLLIVDSEIV